MGNDGFGKAVYDALPQSLNKIFTHQLLPELLENVAEYEQLIFVDASIGQGETEIYEIEPDNSDTANMHHLTPQVFLSFLRSLYGTTPKAYLCAGYFDSFELDKIDDDFGQKVTKAVHLILSVISVA